MSPPAADGPGRLRPGHRAAEARNARHPMALAGPSDGMAHARADRRPVGLSTIGLKCRDRPSDQVDADVGTEHGRKVDRLDDVAIEDRKSTRLNSSHRT